LCIIDNYIALKKWFGNTWQQAGTPEQQPKDKGSLSKELRAMENL